MYVCMYVCKYTGCFVKQKFSVLQGHTSFVKGVAFDPLGRYVIHAVHIHTYIHTYIHTVENIRFLPVLGT